MAIGGRLLYSLRFADDIIFWEAVKKELQQVTKRLKKTAAWMWHGISSNESKILANIIKTKPSTNIWNRYFRLLPPPNFLHWKLLEVDQWDHGIHTIQGWNIIKGSNKITTTVVVRSLEDCTHCARSAFTHLGLLMRAVWLFTTSLHSQPVCSQICSLDIFVNLQPSGCALKKRRFDSLVER